MSRETGPRCSGSMNNSRPKTRSKTGRGIRRNAARARSAPPSAAVWLAWARRDARSASTRRISASRPAAAASGACTNLVRPGGPAGSAGRARCRRSPSIPPAPHRVRARSDGPRHPARAEPATRLAPRDARISIGRDDQDHPMTLGGGPRHRAGREKGLVVRVGMEGHKSAPHVPPGTRDHRDRSPSDGDQDASQGGA